MSAQQKLERVSELTKAVQQLTLCTYSEAVRTNTRAGAATSFGGVVAGSKHNDSSVFVRSTPRRILTWYLRNPLKSRRQGVLGIR